MSVSGETVTCRASVNCTGGDGDDLGVAANGAACCLGNPAALAYSPSSSEDCFACVGESMEVHAIHIINFINHNEIFPNLQYTNYV